VRRTKIIATVGPSSADEAVLVRMMRAGMDVARLNFSHGNRASHARAIRRVRSAAAHVGRNVGLLLDLQGPKLRVGEFQGGSVWLKAGEQTLFTNRRVKGTADLIPAVYSGLMRDVTVGDRILIDDGLIELRVLRKERRGLRCRIVVGGKLADHKGLNFPGVKLSADSLTTKDRGDLAFGMEMGVDFVALSFVRSAADILKLRRLLRGAKYPPLVIAKIERREAIENLESILGEADGVMVARGDLGVEYPPERVPILQKRIIERANAREVLVITATQMLESMVSSPRPTRAEASDVANAIFDGTDAVMLSAETAVGRYPDRAVRTMGRIASESEEVTLPMIRRRTGDNKGALASPTHALAHTAYQAAHELRALRVHPHRLLRAPGEQGEALRADHRADPSPVHVPPPRDGLGSDLRPGSALADRGGDGGAGDALPCREEADPPGGLGRRRGGDDHALRGDQPSSHFASRPGARRRSGAEFSPGAQLSQNPKGARVIQIDTKGASPLHSTSRRKHWIMVNLTEKAATEIRAIMEQNGGTYEGVRVFVAGGGCSGLSYGMEICDEPASAEDQIFETLGVKVIVDLASYEHLKGASIDFDDSLGGGGFKINNPNAVKSCGCGNSFATAEGQEPATGGGCGCGGSGGGCGSH